MLYPRISNVKRQNIAISILLVISLLIMIVCILINQLIKTQVYWAGIVTISIVYIWITCLYSIYRSINIAFHVMMQTICISIFVMVLDYFIGFIGWSFGIAIPIIISVSNITMTILTIISRKKYAKYAIYQILIILFSIIPATLGLLHKIPIGLGMIISSAVTSISFIISLCLVRKDDVSRNKDEITCIK